MAVIGTLEKQSSDPAAGSEIVFTADEDMIVHAIAFTFTTSATVANRFTSLVADDGVDIFFRSNSGWTATASAAADYSAFSGAPLSTGLWVTFPLPDNGLRLRKGDRVRTLTSLLQAGDNFTAAVFQVEHF